MPWEISKKSGLKKKRILEIGVEPWKAPMLKLGTED